MRTSRLLLYPLPLRAEYIASSVGHFAAPRVSGVNLPDSLPKPVTVAASRFHAQDFPLCAA